MDSTRILAVRLGAMGDIIHSLPAVAALKRSAPGARVGWAVDPKWAMLLEGNPYVDEVLLFDRRRWASIRETWNRLRREPFDIAIDFQGLVKSSLVAFASGAGRRIGFVSSQARESLASRLYNVPVAAESTHVVDKNLDLARAAGAQDGRREFPLPPGRPEGELPDGRFILACPLAGWASKQWPLEYYSEVATVLAREGLTLVVNGPPSSAEELGRIRGAIVHLSGIGGLLHATRQAAGVIGVDSGPLHLAAALGRPGVAIFGPTDPARNGPYGGTITVLRDSAATTTYQRDAEISPAMRAVLPAAVVSALRIRLEFNAERMRR